MKIKFLENFSNDSYFRTLYTLFFQQNINGAEILRNFKNILRITPWLRFCSLRGDREKRRRESGGRGRERRACNDHS